MNSPRILSLAFAFALMILVPQPGHGNASVQTAQNPTGDSFASFVYFTGIGCPHCANVDPVLLQQKVRQKDILIVEYEIYRDNVNAPLLMAYNAQLKTGLGVPMIIAGAKKGDALVGDTSILKILDSYIDQHKGNGVPLPAGSRFFADLPLTDLPRMPKIWFKNRVAVKKDMSSKEDGAIKTFLIDGTEPQGCVPEKEKEIALSDARAAFKKACSFGGWILMQD